MEIEKIVIVTQKTWLDGLVEKYNTKEQAKFYIEHLGGLFENYLNFHNQYYRALQDLKKAIPTSIRFQVIEKSFLPSFLFNTHDLIIVLGRDGLVINTAKYIDTQLILGVNPDPSSIDGVLLQFTVKDVSVYIKKIMDNGVDIEGISLAQAKLNTKQNLIGVNDIFIGHRTHQSARYTITYNGMEEQHSSSGVVIATGIGSTGWFKSIVWGSARMSQDLNLNIERFNFDNYRFPWDAKYLSFCVREPWVSKTTGNKIIFGQIFKGEKLLITSNMPENGTIFSDGIEQDRLQFNSGCVAEIGLAEKKISLIMK